MTTTIRHADFVDSIAAALQYISYYHPADYIAHLARAYELEQGPRRARRDRPDPHQLEDVRRGDAGRSARTPASSTCSSRSEWTSASRVFPGSVEDAVNDGVRKGYLDADNPLRASVVGDPHFERKNTRDNTPAVVEMTLVPGVTVDVIVAAKGGGSENKARVRHDEPKRRPRRLGAENRADDGCRLVPAGHARHRHRRHRREGDADGPSRA
jgi:fumarate hydratase class I